MTQKRIHWINTPVINEAMFRYEKRLLTRNMKLWIEKVLELDSQEKQAKY